MTDYDLAALALADDELMANVVRRLTFIAERDEKEQWLPRVRRGVESARKGKSASRKLPPSDIPHWRSQAMCLKVDGDWFTIPTGGIQRQRKAKERELTICEACPVRADCKEYGRSMPFGIWGGLLPRERRGKNP